MTCPTMKANKSRCDDHFGKHQFQIASKAKRDPTLALKNGRGANPLQIQAMHSQANSRETSGALAVTCHGTCDRWISVNGST